MDLRAATHRVSAIALLVLADASFLWMFLSTDALEQLAAHAGAGTNRMAREAFVFAASWRHGMAGNSWLYMPGFFATATAVWLHARYTTHPVAHAERILSGLIALALAFACSLPDSAFVVHRYADLHGTPLGNAVPFPSTAAALRGLYTLVTWSAFVVACRLALLRRAVSPFVVPGILSAGLVVLRPWTVDDFVSDWSAGMADGNPSAQASFALIFVVAALLSASERPSPQPHPREVPMQDQQPPGAEHENRVGG